jgi:hypothetical protein
MDSIYEPMELVRPLPLESELGPDNTVVKCNDPGYICWVGDKVI